jgi:hypothetical protein
MRTTRWSFVLLLTLIVATGAGLVRQHLATNGLRAEMVRQRTQALERARLEADHRRLLAAQPTADELAELLSRRLMVEQLRSQLAALHRREEESARAADAAARPAVPSLRGTSVGFNLWQNAGQATPDAAFQTTLWASVAGNVDALADVLALDDEARSQATATFDRLPAAMQNELGTPERMVALLTAMDVPLGRAAILGQVPTPTGASVSAQLIDAEGKAKVTVFSLKAFGDQWRLMVPAAVVRKYDGWLRSPVAADKTGP